jgi:hypothetical protein
MAQPHARTRETLPIQLVLWYRFPPELSGGCSMTFAKFITLVQLSMLVTYVAIHCITKASAEIRYTEDGGYSEISASLYPKVTANE